MEESEDKMGGRGYQDPTYCKYQQGQPRWPVLPLCCIALGFSPTLPLWSPTCHARTDWGHHPISQAA